MQDSESTSVVPVESEPKQAPEQRHPSFLRPQQRAASQCICAYCELARGGYHPGQIARVATRESGGHVSGKRVAAVLREHRRQARSHADRVAATAAAEVSA